MIYQTIICLPKLEHSSFAVACGRAWRWVVLFYSEVLLGGGVGFRDVYSQTLLPFVSMSWLLAWGKSEKGICSFCLLDPFWVRRDRLPREPPYFAGCPAQSTFLRWVKRSTLITGWKFMCQIWFSACPYLWVRDTMIKTIFVLLKYLFATLRGWTPRTLVEYSV